MKTLMMLCMTLTTLTTYAVMAGPATGATSQPADGVIRRGVPLSKKEALSVSKVISQAQKHAGNYVKVLGAVKSVCKKKGCWFVLQGSGDGSKFVRVTMKHSFFVPTDCEGKAVTVEGTFRSVPLPEAARKHLAEDGGEDPNTVKGSAVELTMVASGVSIES